jgi:hypothetical protein
MNRRSFLGKVFGAVAALAAGLGVASLAKRERGRWIGMDGKPTGEATSSTYDQIAWPVSSRKWEFGTYAETNETLRIYPYDQRHANPILNEIEKSAHYSGIFMCEAHVMKDGVRHNGSHNSREDAHACAILNLAMRDKGMGAEEAVLQLHPDLKEFTVRFV